MRIILRFAEIGDAKEVLDAMGENAAKNLSFFSKPVTLERQREYLQRMTHSPTDRLYLIRDFISGAIVGTVGLHEIDTYNKSARLGILIFNPELRRSGIGSRAVRLALECGFVKLDLNLNKVYAKCFVTNRKMQIFLLKLGFKPEAILKNEYLLRGKYHDMVQMVIFREEFLKEKGVQK